MYTSGTTGQPKGAELTHSNMLHNALLANRLFGLHPHDVHLAVLPLFHPFGQTVQVGAFAVERGSRGYQACPIEGKASLRSVWQADITLDHVQVPAEYRLPGAQLQRRWAGPRRHPQHLRLGRPGPRHRHQRLRLTPVTHRSVGPAAWKASWAWPGVP